jgi:predicted DNA-binding protein (UPF0251 family)
MANYQWIKESEAAQRVNRKPRTLRSLVKSGKWNVTYTNLNGRDFMYDAKSLEKVFEMNAVKIFS